MNTTFTAIAYFDTVPAYEEPTVLWAHDKHSAILAFGKLMLLVCFSLVQDWSCIYVQKNLAAVPPAGAREIKDRQNNMIAVYDENTRTVYMDFKPRGKPRKYAQFTLVDEPTELVGAKLKKYDGSGVLNDEEQAAADYTRSLYYEV